MKPSVKKILQIVFSLPFVISCLLMFSVRSDAGVEEKKVREVAEQYGLLAPSPYSYHFQDKDIRYWAGEDITEDELHAQFQIRQTIRDFARQTGYRIANSRGELTPGDLSYWAERILVAKDPPQQIVFEFRQLLTKQKQAMEAAAKRTLRDDAGRDRDQIRELAEQYGLLDPNPFAWTFQEGDVVWYTYQGLDYDEIVRDFEAKAIVRQAARKTGFYVAGISGQVTPGDLSYWADFVKAGSLSREALMEIFSAKADEARQKPPSQTLAAVVKRPKEGRVISIAGDKARVLIDGSETGGKFSLFEYFVEAGGGPPPHTHAHEDEAFYILEGQFDIDSGGEKIKAGPGTFIFSPQRNRHHLVNTGPQTGRILIWVMPAGLEYFFEEAGRELAGLDAPSPDFTAQDEEKMKEAATQYGLAIFESSSRPSN